MSIILYWALTHVEAIGNCSNQYHYLPMHVWVISIHPGLTEWLSHSHVCMSFIIFQSINAWVHAEGMTNMKLVPNSLCSENRDIGAQEKSYPFANYWLWKVPWYNVYSPRKNYKIFSYWSRIDCMKIFYICKLNKLW